MLVLMFVMMFLFKDVRPLYFGIGFSLLTYAYMRRIFGLDTVKDVKVKAKSVLEGSPESIARAFVGSHCDIDQMYKNQSLL